MGTNNWYNKAQEDARDWIKEELMDTIIEKILAGEIIDDDLLRGDGQDEYHHETHVDKEYDLAEAGELIDELNEYEETDTGIWQGCDFRRAASACAAYTYGNAVYAMAKEILDQIGENSDDILEEIHQDDTVKDMAREKALKYVGED